MQIMCSHVVWRSVSFELSFAYERCPAGVMTHTFSQSYRNEDDICQQPESMSGVSFLKPDREEYLMNSKNAEKGRHAIPAQSYGVSSKPAFSRRDAFGHAKFFHLQPFEIMVGGKVEVYPSKPHVLITSLDRSLSPLTEI